MQIITQNETTPSERRLRFSMNAAADGADITGGAASISVKFRKPGTEDFVAGLGTVTEGDSTDAPGDYYYEATAGEVDTVGVGAFRPVHASGITFTYPFTVTPDDLMTAAPSKEQIADAVAAQVTIAAALANMDAPVSEASTFDPVTDSVTVAGTVRLADGAHGGANTTITGNLVGSLAGNVTGYVLSVVGNVGGNVVGSVGSLGAQAKADVAAELATYDAPTKAEIDAAMAPLATAAAVAALNNLSQAQAQAAAAAALTAYDPPTKAELDSAAAPLATGAQVSSAAAAVQGSVAALNNLSAAQVTAAVLDDAVEGAFSLRQLLRGFAAALLGKLSGAGGTTVAIRDLADTKNRVAATVDSDGNRTAVTLNLD
jgi:hypothetical protein